MSVGLRTTAACRYQNLGRRIDGTNERLEQGQTENNIRLATEVVAVAKAVGQVRDLLREDRIVREKVDDHEKRISTLENRAS